MAREAAAAAPPPTGVPSRVRLDAMELVPVGVGHDGAACGASSLENRPIRRSASRASIESML